MKKKFGDAWPMKCPYCENEMEKGEVQIGDLIDSYLKMAGPVLWLPQTECKKMVPKRTVYLVGKAEGYYCQKCEKVVGIFNERGAEFLQ